MVRRVNRRSFGKWVLRGGILVPFTGPIVRSQVVLSGPIMRTIAAAGGGGGGPAYAGVQGNGGGSAASTTVATGSITTTTGRILIAFICCDLAGSVSGVAGGGTGITWTEKIAKTNDTRHDQVVSCWIGTGYTGGAGAVTATFGGSIAFRAISVVEVSGANATQFNTTATDITDSGTALTIGLTTSVNNCLIVGFTYDDGGADTISAAPAGMTAINNFNAAQNCATHYRTTNPNSGATSVNWTSSGTDDFVSIAVAVAP